jgi:iron complex outermembrane receptor protein
MVTALTFIHHFTPRFRNTTGVFTQFWDAYEPRPFDILDEVTWNVGTRSVFNWDFVALGRGAELVFGVEYIRENYEGATIENLYQDFPGQGSVAGDKISMQEQVRENINVFAQQRIRLSEKLALEAGANFNSTWYGLTTLLAPGDVDQSGNYRFDPVLSPRVGMTYRLAPEKSLYATVSHGFSVPGVAETLTPDGLINTDLKPETGINYELGLKSDWLERKLYTEVAVYSIQVSNLLVALRVGDDQYVGINAGRTAHNGVEFQARYNAVLPSGWIARPYASAALQFYTFRDFVDDDSDFSGNDLTGVPDRPVNVGLEVFSPKGFRASINHLHVGLIPLNDANTAYAEAYHLLNMKLSYKLRFIKGVGILVHAGVNNIMDVNYAASVLPNAVGFGGNAPRYFYPGNPRNFYAGLSVEFGY